MSDSIIPQGAEIHAGHHPIRWVVEGFTATSALVVLMMLLGPAVVIVSVLAVAMFVTDLTR